METLLALVSFYQKPNVLIFNPLSPVPTSDTSTNTNTSTRFLCASEDMRIGIFVSIDISISPNTRRTEGFDILVFVLVLMSRLSSLVHKNLVLVFVFVLVSLVGTGL